MAILILVVSEDGKLLLVLLPAGKVTE